MLRSAARRAFSLVERFANRRGYLVRWIPPLFFVQPEAELRFDLEFVIAHLLLRKKEIFFIQIGANDGKSTDPLYRFVTELGWSGILVEPQPNIFEQLVKNYRHCKHNLKFVNAAVADQDGYRTLYAARLHSGTQNRADYYASFDRDVISRQTQWVPDIAQRIDEISVRCLSMDSLLKLAEGREIDLLQVDTEGYDFEILKMIDFSKFKPAIICYEHAHMSKRDMQAASELLHRQGYRMTRDDLDTIAYRQAFTYGWRFSLTPRIQDKDAATSAVPT